jgi:prepilin peptidase CpaA
MIEAIIMVVFPFAMIYSAFSDALTMTIANRVSLVLIATFVIIAPFIGLTLPEFAMHWVGFGVVLTTTFVLFEIGAMGGGDAKLLAATSLWIGWNQTLLEYLLAASVLGGILTIFLVFFRKSTVATVANTLPQFKHLVTEKDIPYGITLAIAGLMVFPDIPAMQWVLTQMVS